MEEQQRLPVRRALISVFDKSGIVELAAALTSEGVEVVSTGGTAAVLRQAGIPVRDVADVTKWPEMLGTSLPCGMPAAVFWGVDNSSRRPQLCLAGQVGKFADALLYFLHFPQPKIYNPITSGGRVKTLHPAVHAGLLADRNNAGHMQEMQNHGLESIDLVVCNLYPFQKVRKD